MSSSSAERALKLFYIPDGHRRFAEKRGCSLQEAYTEGFRVLADEILDPLFELNEVAAVDVFCLSNLNLRRRLPPELETFLEEGATALERLCNRCKTYASVRTVGSFLQRNIEIQGASDRLVTFVIGSSIEDDLGCGPVDLFMRSGGELRLSGAPRSIIGSYTQFYSIRKLHPEVRFSDVERCLLEFRERYFRRTDIV